MEKLKPDIVAIVHVFERLYFFFLIIMGMFGFCTPVFKEKIEQKSVVWFNFKNQDMSELVRRQLEFKLWWNYFPRGRAATWAQEDGQQF